MNDKDINIYLQENPDVILDIEKKALESCNFPLNYLYVDGNFDEGFQIKTGASGQGATDTDRDHFYATFMSMLNYYIRGLNEN